MLQQIRTLLFFGFLVVLIGNTLAPRSAPAQVPGLQKHSELIENQLQLARELRSRGAYSACAALLDSLAGGTVPSERPVGSSGPGRCRGIFGNPAYPKLDNSFQAPDI
jgi:hypothetical protein